MGRMEAKGKVDRKTGEVKRPARVTEEMMMEWVHREGVELRGAGVDEAPQCYNVCRRSWANMRDRLKSCTP